MASLTHRRCPLAKKPTNSRFFVVLVALLVGEAQAVEPTATDPVTVEQAVKQAVARPTLAAMLAAEAAVEDAEGAVRALWPNPELSYEREQIVGGAHDGAEDAIVISQSLELSGRRGLRADAATRRGDAARLEGEATLRRTAIAARRRFWEVIYQQARHEVATAWLGRLEAAQAIVLARLDAGEGSAYDGLRMAREVRMARTELGLSAVDREGAWLELLALTGPLSAPPQWPRVLGTLVPEEAGQRTAAASVRPDLRAWTKRAEAAELEAEAASRGWVPEVGLSAGWKTVGAGGTRGHGFAAGISLSIPLFDHGQGDEAQARATQARANAIRELLAEDARRRERPAEERARRLATLARQVRAETELAARALEATAHAGWLAGELDLLELLDVHRGARDDGFALLALEHTARGARESLRLITLEEVP